MCQVGYHLKPCREVKLPSTPALLGNSGIIIYRKACLVVTKNLAQLNPLVPFIHNKLRCSALMYKALVCLLYQFLAKHR